MNYKKIPVIIVTGFLGSGKTTLINHVIHSAKDLNIGVLVNEFGDVGIDGALIVGETESVIEITNGCICCTVRSDLVTGIERLLDASGGHLDRIIIETSGLADPAPVLQTFLVNPDLRERLVLESVVTVVDSFHISEHIQHQVAEEQILFADFVILNKSDLLETQEAQARSEALLEKLNPTAERIFVEHSAVQASDFFAGERFSLPNILQHEPDLLASMDHSHEHDLSINFQAFRVDAPLNASLFNHWVNRLVQEQGANLLRMKGILFIAGEPRQFVFHSVHMILNMQPGKPWPNPEAAHTLLVVIGRDIDEMSIRAGLEACVEIPLHRKKAG